MRLILLSVACACLAGAFACGGEERPGFGATEEPLAGAVQDREAARVLESLGADAPSALELAEADALLGSLPEGTSLQQTGTPVVVHEDESVRVELAEYEVRVPGERSRTVVLERWYGREGNEWVVVATILDGDGS
jgi:hypothetical protein